MSSREKNLIYILLLAGFIVVNFLLFSFYTEQKNQAQIDLEAAKTRLQQALMFQESSQQISDQMAWLNENQPAPSTYQEVQSALQQFADSQARNQGLTIKKQELLPTDETGAHFHRVQVKFDLSGKEQGLYSWFDAINTPNALRSVIQIRMTPNTENDTLIDCSATVSQWFPFTL